MHTPPKKERREREDRQRERRRREKPQTIQSHSIFEQGPADTYRKLGKARGDLTLYLYCIAREVLLVSFILSHSCVWR